MKDPVQPSASHRDIEDAIDRACSIGGLERLAGIGIDQDNRYVFWKAYAHLPAEKSLDAGVAEL